MYRDVGMVVQFLGNFSDLVDEFHCCHKVLEFEFTLEPAALAVSPHLSDGAMIPERWGGGFSAAPQRPNKPLW